MAGTPAPVLAERHGVTDYAIRKRGSLGGWTRREHARRTLDLDLPKLGGDRRPPEVIAAKAAADAEAAAALAVARARADVARAEADAEEADPLEAARTLLRRAAASAVAGRLAQAGASVKLAEGLARAAALLGLGGEDGDGWDDEEEEEPRLSPEALEELRDDVIRRYSRFDRVEAGASGPESGPESRPFPEPTSGELSASGPGAVEEGARAFTAWAAEHAAEPARAPPQERAPSGISRPPRAISVSAWPAWAGSPDAWASAAWRS